MNCNVSIGTISSSKQKGCESASHFLNDVFFVYKHSLTATKFKWGLNHDGSLGVTNRFYWIGNIFNFLSLRWRTKMQKQVRLLCSAFHKLLIWWHHCPVVFYSLSSPHCLETPLNLWKSKTLQSKSIFVDRTRALDLAKIFASRT